VTSQTLLNPTIPYQAEGSTILRATAAAVVAGAAILTLFVLPAEYNIDPTGVGHKLGLTALSGAMEDAEPAAASAPTQAAAAPVKVGPQTRDSIIRATPYREDQMTLTIARMPVPRSRPRCRRATSSFFLTASGPVKMDMHGETSMTASEATTYWKEKGLSAAQGSLMAPFNGIHGWYWRNQGETPVTLTQDQWFLSQAHSPAVN
jgi:hypothetical protein